MKIRSSILRSYWSSGQVPACILIARSGDTPGQPPFSSAPVLEDFETNGVRARESDSSVLSCETAYDQLTKSEQKLSMDSSRPSIASERDSMVVGKGVGKLHDPVPNGSGIGWRHLFPDPSYISQ